MITVGNLILDLTTAYFFLAPVHGFCRRQIQGSEPLL